MNMVKNPLVYHIIDIKQQYHLLFSGSRSQDYGWFSIYHKCPGLLSYLILLLFVFDFKITDSS